MNVKLNLKVVNEVAKVTKLDMSNDKHIASVLRATARLVIDNGNELVTCENVANCANFIIHHKGGHITLTRLVNAFPYFLTFIGVTNCLQREIDTLTCEANIYSERNELLQQEIDSLQITLSECIGHSNVLNDTIVAMKAKGKVNNGA